MVTLEGTFGGTKSKRYEIFAFGIPTLKTRTSYCLLSLERVFLFCFWFFFCLSPVINTLRRWLTPCTLIFVWLCKQPTKHKQKALPDLLAVFSACINMFCVCVGMYVWRACVCPCVYNNVCLHLPALSWYARGWICMWMYVGVCRACERCMHCVRAL